MTDYSPTTDYTSGGGATGAFPGTGSNATEDAIAGVSPKLAVVPVDTTTGPSSNALRMLRQAGEDVSQVQPGQQLPYESARLLFYRMSPSERAGVQQQMAAAGLLNLRSQGVTLGYPDQASVNAWFSLVQTTMRTNASHKRQTIDETLQQAIAAQQANLVNNRPLVAPHQGLTGGANNYTIDLSNPEDIAFVAQKAANAILGRKAGPDDIAKITAAIQGQERSGKQAQIAAAEGQQRAAFNAQLASRDAVAAGTSGADTYIAPVTTTTTAAPNTQAEAEAQLRAAHPTEAAAHDSTGVYGTLLSLIRGGGA